MASHRKCMGKLSLMIIKPSKIISNFLAGQRVLKVKCLGNSVPELLYVFEDPAQRLHNIECNRFRSRVALGHVPPPNFRY